MPLPRLVRHPAAIAAAIVVFAALVLLPGIGTPGLWEPQEMAVADQAAARADGTYQAAPPNTACAVTPAIDGARTLTPRVAAWGLAHVSSSDAGLRIPLAMLGLALVVVVFALAWRLGSTRAAVVASLTLISFPLWSLQARQLTGELPGALGGALLVYALVTLAAPRRRAGLGLAVDLGIAALALVVGGRLAFQGSGALVGLLPPLAAVAIAGSFALPELGAGLAAAWGAIDRKRLRPAAGPIDPWRTAAVGAAAIVTLGIAYWIGAQVFDLGPLTPGTRQLGGKSILTADCWSSAVGGLWRKDDNLLSTYDGLFEQAGFGMYPAALLVVVALGALVSGLGDPRRRFAGALVFAWAAGAWVAAAVFARKVGPVVFTGFPACAVAVGLFVDDLYRRRAEADADPVPYRRAAWALLGLIVLLGTIVLGKDLQAFPERLTSLPFGSADGVKYPAQARLLGMHTKAWILILGVVAALPFAVDVWLWAPRRADGAPHGVPRQIARYGLPASLAGLLVIGLYWSHGWHRGLSQNLSSKHIFAAYHDLRKPADTLGILGAMGNAPRYYAGGPWDKLNSRDELLGYLRRPTRVFAMAPAGELCAIHRAKADGLTYFVLDDSNTQTLLLSNQLGGATDQNPIATAILRERPADVGTPVSAEYDGAIELIGVKMPKTVARGDDFEMTLFYQVKKTVPGTWKVFVHFDGGQRFNGDHPPIRERCATSFWQPGDFIVDRFKVSAGNVSFNKGPYVVYTGLFTGSNPNWRNMPVTRGDKDANNRVKIGTLILK